MTSPADTARMAVRHALFSAVLVRPMDPGLDEAELVRILTQAGFARGAVDDALSKVWFDQSKDAAGRAVAEMSDCTVLYEGLHDVPRDLIPLRALKQLEAAFRALDGDLTEKRPKQLPLLLARCPELPRRDVELALGLMIPMRRVAKVADGYVRVNEILSYDMNPQQGPYPGLVEIRRLIPIVTSILADRSDRTVPETRPLDRFGVFLRGQGWSELESWWVQTVAELDSLSHTHQPTSACLLCGALLEGALVAIAVPARKSGGWNQNFLKEPSRTWKLGQLIKQAEAAKTISPNLAALARTTAELRNRIHAGQYASDGSSEFEPPYTNTHEADVAKDHLSVLLDAILRWPAIAQLESVE